MDNGRKIGGYRQVDGTSGGANRDWRGTQKDAASSERAGRGERTYSQTPDTPRCYRGGSGRDPPVHAAARRGCGSRGSPRARGRRRPRVGRSSSTGPRRPLRKRQTEQGRAETGQGVRTGRGDGEIERGPEERGGEEMEGESGDFKQRTRDEGCGAVGHPAQHGHGGGLSVRARVPPPLGRGSRVGGSPRGAVGVVRQRVRLS